MFKRITEIILITFVQFIGLFIVHNILYSLYPIQNKEVERHLISASVKSAEDYDDQAGMFNFEQDPDQSEKKCTRCFEIGAKFEAIVQDHIVEDKLDPKEVEDAFKQIRRQSFKNLKKAHSKSLELELNCKMLESSRDRWQKQADGLGKEITKVY